MPPERLLPRACATLFEIDGKHQLDRCSMLPFGRPPGRRTVKDRCSKLVRTWHQIANNAQALQFRQSVSLQVPLLPLARRELATPALLAAHLSTPSADTANPMLMAWQGAGGSSGPALALQQLQVQFHGTHVLTHFVFGIPWLFSQYVHT